MAHIHTQPGQHDTTVSAYIIRLDGLEPTLLLHRHKKLHKYMQFGGHIELHENPWQAIAHELAEESGYSLHQLHLLQPPLRIKKMTGATLHPYPVAVQTHQFSDHDHYHTDISYAFTCSQPPLGEVGEGESSEFRLFTAEQLTDASAHDIPENVRETGLFILYECLKHWQPVVAV